MWEIIIFVILTALAIILLSGKGGFLIAGYNILSRKEKQLYDEEKMSRVIGVLLTFIDAGVLADLLFHDFFSVHGGYALLYGIATLIFSVVAAVKIIRK